MDTPHKQRLSRLEQEYYRGLAWVHWILTIEDRRTGWLESRFHYKFREVLAHAAFRYQFACPIYCLMPDYLHMLWCGLSEGTQAPVAEVAKTFGLLELQQSPPKVLATSATDQLTAMKTFRKDTNECLKKIGYEFHRQPYDHVLREKECNKHAIEDVAEYIARNPERKKLVAVDDFAKYSFTGCLVPGYPNLKLFQIDSWDRIWRTLSFLKRTECFRRSDPKHTQSPNNP